MSVEPQTNQKKGEMEMKKMIMIYTMIGLTFTMLSLTACDNNIEHDASVYWQAGG